MYQSQLKAESKMRAGKKVSKAIFGCIKLNEKAPEPRSPKFYQKNPIIRLIIVTQGV